MSQGTDTFTSALNVNCPTMEPTRPAADRTPILLDRKLVGNDSDDKQSSCEIATVTQRQMCRSRGHENTSGSV